MISEEIFERLVAARELLNPSKTSARDALKKDFDRARLVVGPEYEGDVDDGKFRLEDLLMLAESRAWNEGISYLKSETMYFTEVRYAGIALVDVPNELKLFGNVVSSWAYARSKIHPVLPEDGEKILAGWCVDIFRPKMTRTTRGLLKNAGGTCIGTWKFAKQHDVLSKTSCSVSG
jgi:hypothetical protein